MNMKCMWCKKEFPHDQLILTSKVQNKKKLHIRYSCNPCNTTRCKKTRKTKTGKASVLKAVYKYAKRNPEKRVAWNLAQKVKKEPCSVCGNVTVHRHHPDYSKPEKVIFLCPLHHARLHKQQNPSIDG